MTTQNNKAMNVNLSNNFLSDIKQLNLMGRTWLPITLRLKEIKKRRALRGKQRVELLINSAGKRTVMLLIPSFFYFFNPFFVIRHSFAPIKHCGNLKLCASNEQKLTMKK